MEEHTHINWHTSPPYHDQHQTQIEIQYHQHQQYYRFHDLGALKTRRTHILERATMVLKKKSQTKWLLLQNEKIV